jgi:hypothetical protein
VEALLAHLRSLKVVTVVRAVVAEVHIQVQTTVELVAKVALAVAVAEVLAHTTPEPAAAVEMVVLAAVVAALALQTLPILQAELVGLAL